MEMYDEVVEVKNSREVDSPPDLDVRKSIDFVRQEDLGRITDEEEQTFSSAKVIPKQLTKMSEIRPQSSLKKKHPSFNKSESFGSESDSSDTGSEDNKVPIEGDFNPRVYDNLDVPADVKEIFQYISRYTPQKIDIDYKLQPFIPEFIPAVGDIDAFLKVVPPEPFENKKEITQFLSKLGLEILDEPCGQQSEPALLHMKLRSVSTGPRTPGPPPAVAKSPKDIERWISELQMIHANQPGPTVVHNRLIPDIDSLMSEWPPEMEKALDSIGFPSASLDCSLSSYIDLVCSLLDIPIKEKTQSDYIIALYTLFNLYSAVKNNPVGM